MPSRTSRPTSTSSPAASRRRTAPTGALVTQGGGIYVHNNVRGLQLTDNVIRGNGGSLRRRRPGRHAVHGRQPELRPDPGPQPDPGQRWHQPRRRHRPLHRQRRLLGDRQRDLRQPLRGVRRRDLGVRLQGQPAPQPPAARSSKQPDLVQRLLRRGRRGHGRRRAAADPDPALARDRVRSPSTATSSRRTSPTTTAAASGCCRRAARTSRRPTPGHDLDHQQHHRQQRLGPRGWRHRPGRRGLRQHRRQHGRQEPDHRDGRHQRRARRAGRAVDRDQQRPAAGRLRSGSCSPAARRSRRRTFSKPTLLDDVFCDNRAGSFSGGYVTGIGGTLPDGTAASVQQLGHGRRGRPAARSPRLSSVLQSTGAPTAAPAPR